MSSRSTFCRAAALGLLVLVLTARSSTAAIPIVTGGQAAAIVVTSDRPSPVVAYAARELVHHVKLATAVTLRVMRESDAAANGEPRLYIGDCKAARAAGIRPAELSPEACVLRTIDEGSLCIAGNDGGGDPLDADTRAGTLWGVYEWLERTLQARWLWPGDLGTFVPKRTEIIAEKVDEVIPMRFIQRRVRPGLSFAAEHPALGFTEEAAKAHAEEQKVFLRRHRMGRSYAFGYGHAFVDWWAKEGKAHPEWFQLREDGNRGPSKKNGRFSMCVSNSILQEEMVKRWQAAGGGARTPSFTNACENDILGLCACSKCRALDGPPPADYLAFYPPESKVAGARFVSDRYAHFWLALQQRAARINPEATVIGYAYFNYFSAPTSGIRLNPHILLGYCPSGGWFPRSPDEHTWMKAQWTGWHATGARLFMRTNHLLDGYCMPYIFVHQFADEFHHAAAEGMVATDYDSLTGHWATQGPNLYVALRLHAKPDASVDALLAEYYSGFGAAAGKVKQYFDDWEAYTAQLGPNLPRVMKETEASRWRTWARAAHVLYPINCFGGPEALLRQAALAAKDDPGAAARVAFLQNGLEHARLCSRAAAKLSLAAPEASAEEGKAALDALIRFRRCSENSGISNFNHLAWVEDLSWRLSEETKKSPELYP